MTIRTEAEQALAHANEHLLEALSALNRVLVERVHGSAEYRAQYIDRLWTANIHMIEAAKRLAEEDKS